jgi:hypothetical protein
MVPDAPERAMAAIRDFIERRQRTQSVKTKPAPEGAGDS